MRIAPLHRSYRTIHKHHNFTSNRLVILFVQRIDFASLAAIEGESRLSLSFPSLLSISTRTSQGDDDCPSVFANK